MVDGNVYGNKMVTYLKDYFYWPKNLGALFSRGEIMHMVRRKFEIC